MTSTPRSGRDLETLEMTGPGRTILQELQAASMMGEVAERDAIFG